MKWIPVGLMGIAAFIGTVIGSLLLHQLDTQSPGSGTIPFFYDALAAAAYLLVATAAIAAIALAFLRLAWVSKRGEISTRRALGASRQDLAREALGQGLRMGLMASAAGLLAGTVFAEAGPLAAQDWQLFSTRGLYPLVAVTWIIVVTIVAGATTAVWGIAMSSMTRGTPTEADTAAVADSPRSRAVGRVSTTGRGTRVVLAVGAFSWGVMVMDRLLNLSRVDIENFAVTVWLSDAVGVFSFVAAISVPVIGWFVLKFIAEALTAPVARALRYGTRGFGARSFAADGLTQRTGLRTGAVMTMAIVAALATVTVGSYALGERLNDTAERLSAPVAVMSYPDPKSGPSVPGGFEREALDPQLLEALSKDGRIHVVPYALLRGNDSYEFVEMWPDDRVEQGTRQATYLAVDIAASDAVVPNGYRLLGLTDGTLVAAGEGNYSHVEVNPGRHEITAGGVSEAVHPFRSSSRDSVVSLEWAREHFGPAPISGALIYAVDDTVDVWAVVSEHVAPGQAYTFSHDGSYGVGGLSDFDDVAASGTLILAGLIVAVAMITSLAEASQRLRRREYATMAALGATPTSLRLAPAIEAAVTATIAIVTGAAAGLTFWLATANPYLTTPGAPLDAGEALWHLGAHLGLFPWALLAVGALVTVASATLTSLVFGVSMQQRTPVEELKTAMKEGVS